MFRLIQTLRRSGRFSFNQNQNIKNSSTLSLEEAYKILNLDKNKNKTTIEVIEKKDDKDPSDKLWGLAWEVESIEATHKRLLEAGVDVTPIKEGIKEKTLVATINSHTHNVPTLLIEHAR